MTRDVWTKIEEGSKQAKQEGAKTLRVPNFSLEKDSCTLDGGFLSLSRPIFVAYCSFHSVDSSGMAHSEK